MRTNAKREGLDVPNQPQRDEVMSNKLIVVLPRFLKFECEHYELLAPVCCLHEIVALKLGLHVPVRII